MRLKINPNALGATLAIALCAGVAHAAVLPSGGAVAKGQVAISAPSGGVLTINQTSTNAIIDWSSFSIGAAGSVQINNGSGATLNRVTGPTVSTIDGLLNATGSVYLINPSGVIIGKTGQVNVGGAFVASTLDLADDAFSKASKTFAGASGAAVINLGSISALGGDVVLIANTVRNSGSISAPNGDIGLLAGSSVLIRDMATDDGKFVVKIGGAGTSVVNQGDLQAAMVELRANQGNVYALAGNTTSIINATGVSTKDGKVFLVAEDGYTVAHGVINATQSNGAGGDVITSGITVGIDGANVGAGNWTIQQDGFVLTPAAAANLSADLAWTNITIQTLGSNNGTTGGDITLAAPLSWSSSNSLTLSARHNITFQDGVTLANSDGAAITLAADNKGLGRGTVVFGAGANVSTAGAVSIFYDPAGNDKTSVNSFSYTDPTNFSSDVSAGSLTSYMLVNTVYDLQNIENNLSGSYALGRNIDASSTAGWNGGAGFTPIGSPFSTFTGIINGQNYEILDVDIYLPGGQKIGLISDNDGLIENISLIKVSILGMSNVGGLVGELSGSIRNASVSGTVTGSSNVVGGVVGTIDETGSLFLSSFNGQVSNIGRVMTGGLVGLNYGSVQDSRTTGTVDSGVYVGGVIGANDSTLPVENIFSTATVIGDQYLGGVVGWNMGILINSYSSTQTSGYYAGNVAGLNSGTINNAYWISNGSQKPLPDQYGYAVGANGGLLTNVTAIGPAVGIDPSQQSTYVGFDFSPTGPWVAPMAGGMPTLNTTN